MLLVEDYRVQQPTPLELHERELALQREFALALLFLAALSPTQLPVVKPKTQPGYRKRYSEHLYKSQNRSDTHPISNRKKALNRSDWSTRGRLPGQDVYVVRMPHDLLMDRVLAELELPVALLQFQV